MKTNKSILIGYRNKQIELYKTEIKPLGYVVGTLAGVCLAIAIIPNGLGFIFYPLALFLFGLIGVDVFRYYKRIVKEWRLLKYKFGGLLE